jgi:hypothetical protein
MLFEKAVPATGLASAVVAVELPELRSELESLSPPQPNISRTSPQTQQKEQSPVMRFIRGTLMNRSSASVTPVTKATKRSIGWGSVTLAYVVVIVVHSGVFHSRVNCA